MTCAVEQINGALLRTLAAQINKRAILRKVEVRTIIGAVVYVLDYRLRRAGQLQALEVEGRGEEGVLMNKYQVAARHITGKEPTLVNLLPLPGFERDDINFRIVVVLVATISGK